MSTFGILNKARAIARHSAKKVGEGASGLAHDIKSSSPMDRLKLGLAVTGAGLGAASFVRNSRANDSRQQIDQQSLAALKKIHKALVEEQKAE